MFQRQRKRGGWWCAAVALSLGAGPASGAVLPMVEAGARNQVPDCVTPERLMAFLARRNSGLDRRFRRLAWHYARHGQALGVRWDVAFFQMMVETAGLTFRRDDGRPGDVRASDNNFAGLGAVGDGRPGEVFATPSDGVRAHLEHVLHYAGRKIANPVASRTRKVQEWGVLAPWHRQFQGHRISYSDLALRWSPGNVTYLETIIRLAQQYQSRYCGGRPVLVRAPQPRDPEIASTGWSFELPKGAGVGSAVAQAAPSGRPVLTEKRSTLGRAPAPVRAIAPRREPSFQVASLVPLPTPHAGGVRGQAAVTMSVPVAHAAPARKSPAPVKTAPKLDPQAQQEQRIRDLISGRKVLLKTRVGATIPILFDADGSMRGHAGSLGFFLGASQDSGKWWTAKGQLCQRWRTWLDGDVHCIELRERGGIIHWQSPDGERGTARVVAR